MIRRPAWLREKLLTPNEPRTAGEFSPRPTAPVCQSWNTAGHWAGWPCGNDAKYQVGAEVACHTHVGQAAERNPGIAPIPIPDVPAEVAS